MLKRLPGLILLVVVALLTQVGGLALALGWLVGQLGYCRRAWNDGSEPIPVFCCSRHSTDCFIS